MNGIVQLTVSNLLRVKAAEVRPDGSLVIVGGRNDQGKSSLLNSIALAMSGKDVPTQPIRAGETEGHVILQTDDLTVTRRFTAAGGSTLEVRDATGAKITSPQAKLDLLYSRVTFDPLTFTRQKPEDQLETLKRIVGLDFAALDTEFATKYEERTAVNRRLKDKQSQLTNISRDPSAPEKEVSVAELMEQLEAVNAKNAEHSELRDVLSGQNDEVDAATQRVSDGNRDVAEIEQRLKIAKQLVLDRKQALTEAVKQRDATKKEVATLIDEPTDPIANAIRNAETVNAGVRNNAKWNEEHKASLALQNESDKLSERLTAIEKEKSAAMQKTQFPVEGLSFGNAGVLYKGVPFEQAGTAVKIRTSVAIARSLAPKLPVMLVRDGSLLDDDSMKLLAEEAEKNGLQVWLEVIGNREDATVIMQEGEVSDRPAARKKAAKTK